MAKTAKAAANTPAQNSGKDLFSDLPEPRRLSGKTTRGSRLASGAEARYTARDIEVLEGLEPVRRRPGMYIGGTDEKALHHLFAEVIDNCMDEALAGHASFIEVELTAEEEAAFYFAWGEEDPARNLPPSEDLPFLEEHCRTAYLRGYKRM